MATFSIVAPSIIGGIMAVVAKGEPFARTLSAVKER